MNEVQQELLNRMREKRKEAPWAYDAFARHLLEPAPFDETFEALVVLSHEVSVDGKHGGMTAENEARVREAARRLMTVDDGGTGNPFLLIVSSNEIDQAMRQVALDEGVPADRIEILADKPLNQCNSAQQMQDLAAFLDAQGIEQAYILSSFYHMVRCERTATKWFKDVELEIHLAFGYILWPDTVDALMSHLVDEVAKVTKYGLAPEQTKED